MSFAAPAYLLGLPAVAALAVLYGRGQRARRRAAQAFAAPALGPSVAPRRPGWRRHAPVAVLGLALAALVAAAARPQATVAVPVERASVMLVIDVSGSMLATDVAPSRLEAVRRAARIFADRAPHQLNIGVMAFNQSPTVLQAPTQDRAAVRDALGQLRSSGGTATGTAVQAATRLLAGRTTADGKRAPAAIVLLSDGSSTRGVDPVEAARAAGRRKIPVSTVSLGTAGGTITVPRPGGQGGTETRKVPPDRASLRQIAQVSGGEAYTAADAGHLDQVYEHLGSQLGRERRPVELTAAFAGGALVLLVGAAAMSLPWFGRIV